MGHVQGGVLVALAEHTARTALDGGWVPTSVSANFVRPGTAPAVRAMARVVYLGRTTAVVRALLTNADGRPCLDTTVAYAAGVSSVPSPVAAA